MTHFPISGVDTYWWLPAAVAFGISCFTSTGGVSGAVLILPFQVSFLGFAGPSVSPTNLFYNIVAIPTGVLRYIREKRMIWPLAWIIAVGTTPGIFFGAIARICYLPNPRAFKLFAGCVLGYIGVRLLLDFFHRRVEQQPSKQFEVTDLDFSLSAISYNFNGIVYRVTIWKVILLSAIVGIVGGVYGIGGGAIIAPVLATMFGLPVHSIAGVALFGTFISSIIGVIFYTIVAPFYTHTGLPIAPDWLLGASFGVGGAAGMYVGARIQRFVSSKVIKAVLATVTLFTAVKYIADFFL